MHHIFFTKNGKSNYNDIQLTMWNIYWNTEVASLTSNWIMTTINSAKSKHVFHLTFLYLLVISFQHILLFVFALIPVNCVNKNHLKWIKIGFYCENWHYLKAVSAFWIVFSIIVYINRKEKMLCNNLRWGYVNLPCVLFIGNSITSKIAKNSTIGQLWLLFLSAFNII